MAVDYMEKLYELIGLLGQLMKIIDEEYATNSELLHKVSSLQKIEQNCRLEFLHDFYSKFQRELYRLEELRVLCNQFCDMIENTASEYRCESSGDFSSLFSEILNSLEAIDDDDASAIADAKSMTT